MPQGTPTYKYCLVGGVLVTEEEGQMAEVLEVGVLEATGEGTARREWLAIPKTIMKSCGGTLRSCQWVGLWNVH
jgi:hypothetical protein